MADYKKSVLISIKPKWCGLIASGKKTIEVRKNRPKLDAPFKCYIYCTRPTEYFYRGIGESLDELYRIPHDAPYDAGRIKFGYSGELMCCGADYDSNNFLCRKVIGEFVCNKIITVDCDSAAPYDLEIKSYIGEETCLTRNEFVQYTGFKRAYGWQISDLKIYDKPRELADFGLKRAPQSWCYVEEKDDAIEELQAENERLKSELGRIIQMNSRLEAQNGGLFTRAVNAERKVIVLNDEVERLKKKLDEAVGLSGRLVALCTPPREFNDKLFRRHINRPGDYMGSGWDFVDGFERMFDEFLYSAGEETYYAVRDAAESERKKWREEEGKA